MESFTVFDDRYSGAPHKLDKLVLGQCFGKRVDFFAMPGGFKDRIVVADHHGARAVLTQQPFHGCFFGYNLRWHLVERLLLPDDFVIRIVIRLEHLYLFFYLATQFAYHILCFVDHQRKSVDTLGFRRGGVETFDINFTPRKDERNAADHSDRVLCVYRNCIFLLFHDSGLFVHPLVVTYFRRISDTLLPCGTIGNTLFSLPTITSSRYGDRKSTRLNSSHV